VIARIWRGTTLQSKADSYMRYLERTGLKEYRSTKGNRGVTVLRRIKDGKAEFILISYWDSMEAIKSFAGPDTEKPVYYPEDKDYLIERESKVSHYHVMTPIEGGNPPRSS
jgi:heme-degrading monooxygenase HmoA